MQNSIQASCQGLSCSLSPCRVNQNMDKEWPHELALTCLGHQVTIVRLGEQVTHTRPAAMLQTAMWGRCMVVADLQLAAAGSRQQAATLRSTACWLPTSSRSWQSGMV